MKAKEEFLCPKCKHKNRIKIKDVVTAKEDIMAITTKKFFYHECKKCNEAVFIEYPLKVIGSNYIIYYTPGENKDVLDNTLPIVRVCDTYDDLKEKIFILEDNLNDIVIEFLKDYIKHALDDKYQKKLERVRYNSKDENNLYFSLLGLDSLTEISLENYENIKKELKVKKIKKGVLIDEYTYSNFYKMRLLWN